MEKKYFVHETSIIDNGCVIGDYTKNLAFFSYYEKFNNWRKL